MTTEQLKNWIKTQDTDYEGCIQLGGVNSNVPQFLGIFPGNANGRQHIAIGGPICTSYDAANFRLLLRWGKSQPDAEKKARGLWGLFYGTTNVDMDGTSVSYIDPGSGPVPLGRGADGVFEYVINLTIYYMKE